ncbi:hypothetical protein NN561_015749 [Cricetulus griseus]
MLADKDRRGGGLALVVPGEVEVTRHPIRDLSAHLASAAQRHRMLSPCLFTAPAWNSNPTPKGRLGQRSASSPPPQPDGAFLPEGRTGLTAFIARVLREETRWGTSGRASAGSLPAMSLAPSPARPERLQHPATPSSRNRREGRSGFGQGDLSSHSTASPGSRRSSICRAARPGGGASARAGSPREPDAGELRARAEARREEVSILASQFGLHWAMLPHHRPQSKELCGSGWSAEPQGLTPQLVALALREGRAVVHCCQEEGGTGLEEQAAFGPGRLGLHSCILLARSLPPATADSLARPPRLPGAVRVTSPIHPARLPPPLAPAGRSP